MVGYPFPMQVRVLLFGVLKDMFSSEGETLDLPPGATVDTLLARYRQAAPAIGNLLPTFAVAVNREYAPLDRVLAEGDEVALLPPVSGGSASGASPDAALRVGLLRGPIGRETILGEMKSGEDGAVVVFDGVVRDNTRGRRTLYLVYEAYEEMALSMMRDLAGEALKREVRAVALFHRLGRLEVGETSVLIAVASAHRAPAFEACRWLIDNLKKSVPIWKKEHFEDGAVWVQGEPFPPEIARKGIRIS